MCKNGLRNVCRECGQDGHFMEDGYIPKQWWSKEEEEFFISVYPNYTCEELVEKYYPDMTTKQLWDKAYNLGVSYKNENTVKRANEQRSNKMSGENSPFYGVPKSSETIDKFKISIKRYYKENNGWWLGKKRSEKQRNMLSERMKGNWAGDKNPRYVNPLKGKDNPNWRGGITQLYFELRSEIKEWQQNSMKSCNYKCVLTNGEFDNVHHLYPFKDIVNEVFEILRLDFRNKVNDYLEEEFNKHPEKTQVTINIYPDSRLTPDEFLKVRDKIISLVYAMHRDLIYGGNNKKAQKDFKETMSVAEQLFASLHSIAHSGFWSFLKPEEHLSFEIVAKSEDIRFYVAVPKKLTDLVEKQIHGAYPGADIKVVEEYSIFKR